MNASKFTNVQQGFVIKQRKQGAPVAEVSRKSGIRQATDFNSEKQYVRQVPAEMRWLRSLENKNARLRRIFRLGAQP